MLLLARGTATISTKLYIKLSYLHNRGRFPNLKNPKNVSEIILSQMYYGKVDAYSDYVDKIKVRDFLVEIGFGQYLSKIYGVWDSFEEIDFCKLPSAFALKTNHGCGNHYICKNKNDIDIEKAKNIINYAMCKKYGIAETQYHSIKRKVYCEEYLGDEDGELPVDYKYICTDGKIKCILVVIGRSGAKYKLITYSDKWERLDYVKSHCAYKGEVEKPTNFDLMTGVAKKISQMFEFIRVDFYDLGYKVILGELTFTPQGGIMSNFSNEAICEMGRK